MDLDAARSALGLPDGFDPVKGSGDSGDAGRRFALDAAQVIPYLSGFSELPLRTAIDLSRVSSAASNGFPSKIGVLAMETSQPFSEISDQLGGLGYKLEGGLWHSNKGFLAVVYKFVGESDGVVALANTRKDVEQALSGDDTGADDPRLQMLESVGGPAAATLVPKGDGIPGCARAMAIGDQMKDGAGTLAITVNGDANPADLLLGRGSTQTPPGEVPVFSPTVSFRLGDPSADGESLQVPFTYPLAERGSPIGLLLTPNSFDAAYKCGQDPGRT